MGRAGGRTRMRKRKLTIAEIEAIDPARAERIREQKRQAHLREDPEINRARCRARYAVNKQSYLDRMEAWRKENTDWSIAFRERWKIENRARCILQWVRAA